MSSKPKAPSYLNEAGQTLWDAVVKEYDLRIDELRVLSSACVAADMEGQFLAAWVELGCPMMSKGSMGQEVEHPLIGSIDKQAKSKVSHLKQLRLPDTTDTPEARSTAARAAANARWSRRGA